MNSPESAVCDHMNCVVSTSTGSTTGTCSRCGVTFPFPPPTDRAPAKADRPRYSCYVAGCPGEHESKDLACNDPTSEFAPAPAVEVRPQSFKMHAPGAWEDEYWKLYKLFRELGTERDALRVDLAGDRIEIANLLLELAAVKQESEDRFHAGANIARDKFALKAELALVREALLRYGRHDDGCEVNELVGPCHCGYRASLTHEQGAEGEHMTRAAHDDLPPGLLIRAHRGGLDDSLATCEVIRTVEDLIAYVNKYWVKDEQVVLSQIAIEDYKSFDTRIGWQTYIVTVDGRAFGFTNGPMSALFHPLTPSKAS